MGLAKSWAHPFHCTSSDPQFRATEYSTTCFWHTVGQSNLVWTRPYTAHSFSCFPGCGNPIRATRPDPWFLEATPTMAAWASGWTTETFQDLLIQVAFSCWAPPSPKACFGQPHCSIVKSLEHQTKPDGAVVGLNHTCKGGGWHVRGGVTGSFDRKSISQRGYATINPTGLSLAHPFVCNQTLR